jgi:hypothetical protein
VIHKRLIRIDVLEGIYEAHSGKLLPPFISSQTIQPFHPLALSTFHNPKITFSVNLGKF